MQISSKDWKNYIYKLSKLSDTAGALMQEWVAVNGFEDRKALIDYAHALVVKYGEGSATLSAMMYEAVAEMEKVIIDPAELAEMPSYNDIAKVVNGAMKQSPTGQLLSNAMARQVKQIGADTTLKNAIRDKAQFAWVPSGDTCAFCIALASRGWQTASKKALRNGHAEHIHGNCDCQYTISFNGTTNIEGYDPGEYSDMYYSAEGNTPNEKINSMRRMNYAERKDIINAQKREAYAIRNENEEV